MTKNSVTDPIRVDWLLKPRRGRVGLTFAPGKKEHSAFSGIWDRDLEEDLRRLRDVYAADHLVCLLEDHEMDSLGITNLVEAASGAGISVHRLPVQDGWLPVDAGAFSRLVADIMGWMESGENVVIHCKGGLGRAGTMGGCVLVAAGLSPDEALRALHDARGPGCPENAEQRQYISRFQP